MPSWTTTPIPAEALPAAVGFTAAPPDAASTPLAGPASLPAPLSVAAPVGGAAMAEARLAAAPGSADFGHQLGAQLTTFVREGVEHARLHLNPAELGPVTVRIRIDGDAAHVHLGVEHALTRQALEQSMPLLAGNLREAGLTLTGGGVFEQPRQPGDGTPQAARSSAGHSRHGDTDAEPALHTVAGGPRRRGVVDLVA
jgi:flagellar hook-length control protein FliK